ncbi:Catenin delta-1, partial [Xenotaenia resolanae]
LTENCVCLLRNLSYHVHIEVPGAERYQETTPNSQGSASFSQKSRRFSSRRGKGKKNDDANADKIQIPVRTTPAKGYELLFQPEVVRIYTSLLKESRNPTVLEASAGAIQNLCAGRWTDIVILLNVDMKISTDFPHCCFSFPPSMFPAPSLSFLVLVAKDAFDHVTHLQHFILAWTSLVCISN